jgi:inosine-uridine nucleoside N-ribohydrolase
VRATAAVTRRLLVTLGNPVPVRLGAGNGLLGPYPDGRDPFHGPAGLGVVFCGAALTCVAQALAGGVAITEVVWMGGAVAMGGNMTAAAEFNAWMDPPAADLVLASGVPVRMVPLDVTERFAWADAELTALRDMAGPGRCWSGPSAS